MVLRLPDAPLQYIPNSKLLGDLLHFYCFAFVSKCGVTSDDKDSGSFRKSGDDLLGKTIAEISMFGIFAHVGKGKHSNRRFVRKGESHFLRVGFFCGTMRRTPEKLP